MCFELENEVELEDVSFTMTEALSRLDTEKRRGDMQETNSFEENQTWELTDQLEKSTVVECKWIFKVKYDSENKVGYRARLVVKGFTQKVGIYYAKTLAPVLRFSTLTLLVALAVNLKLTITHLDVKTAFLNGLLEEKVYMRQPEGYVEKNLANKVCRLKKAVYGLLLYMLTIFFIFSNNQKETVFLKQQLSMEFKIKDLGEASRCLEIRIRYNQDK